MVMHQRGDVGTQPLAGAQPAEHRTDQLGAPGIVTDEASHARPRTHTASQGLCGVVQQRSPPQRLSTGHLIGQRLGQQRGNIAPMRTDATSTRYPGPTPVVNSIVRSSASSVWP